MKTRNLLTRVFRISAPLIVTTILFGLIIVPPAASYSSDSVFMYPACVDGLRVDINGAASPGSYVSYISWNWGDGATSTSFLPTSHLYGTQGTYNITVTAYYNDGSSASASTTVSVAPGDLYNYEALTITAGQGGSVSYTASVGSGTVSPGDSQTLYLAYADDLSLSAVPNTGYNFGSWVPSTNITGLGGSAVATSSPSISIVVTGNSNILANFIQTSPQANIEISTPEIVNNLGPFDAETAGLGFGRYCDATVSVTVSPADLVENVQLETNYGNFGEGSYRIDGGFVLFTQGADGTYSWEIIVFDPNGAFGFLVGELIPADPASLGSLFGFSFNQPVISSVVVTDIYGQTHEQDFNIPVPTIQDVSVQTLTGTWTAVQEFCPIDLLVTDSQNRSIGAIYQNGVLEETVNQIPGAYFIGQYGSNSPKIFLLPFSADSYNITGYAFGAGSFNLTVFTYIDNQTRSSMSETGSVVAQEVLNYRLMTDSSGEVTLYPATSTGITSSVDPSVYGQPVTFSANVTALAPATGTPTGNVTFSDGGTILGNGTLNGSGQATYTTSALSAGNHTITAAYGGDANFAGSTGNLTQTVNQASTATTVSSSINPSIYGESVTFNANVTAVAPGVGTPTGNITFNDGASVLGNATLNGSGQATYTTSTLNVGNHTIVAAYSGDTNFAASSGNLTQTVMSARDLKSSTVAGLESAKTGDRGVDRITHNVIDQINGSLSPGLWIDGLHLVFQPKLDWLQVIWGRFQNLGRTLGNGDMDNDATVSTECVAGFGNGIMVFHEEKNAADIMQNNIKDYQREIAVLSRAKRIDADEQADLAAMQKVMPVYKGALSDLVQADNVLAQVAITEAHATSIKYSSHAKIVAYELAQADAELAKATASSNASDAIYHYGRAWFDAEMAIRFATVQQLKP